LTTRLLYRLRFTGEQRPFDTVSLVYILSFISLILEKGGIGVKDTEEIDEQVVLAIEFLSFHTETCKSPFQISQDSQKIKTRQAPIQTFHVEILLSFS
jgi:hypothetical protein